ncbi:MAG: tyrosine-type recombinase/integrase [Anaerolineaceae bacterium]
MDRLCHTFALQYQRNGVDIFTLQKLLGHSSVEMIRRYFSIVKSDCELAHLKAGLVDNWRL